MYRGCPISFWGISGSETFTKKWEIKKNKKEGKDLIEPYPPLL